METTAADVRRAAMDMLARREQSRRELRYKLGRKFSSVSDLIDIELETLTNEGLQSDSRLAEAVVRSRAGRGQGQLKIRAELKKKGIEDQDIQLALEECGVDWFECIALAAEKRFGTEPPEDAKDRARRQRFLQQRGFSYEEIASLY